MKTSGKHALNPHEYRRISSVSTPRARASRCVAAPSSRCLPAGVPSDRSSSLGWEKHRQLCPRQRNRTILGLRPNETATLKSLGKQAQTFAIPPKQSYGVAPAPAKNKHAPGKWLPMKYSLYLRAESRKTSPHIGHACDNPDPGARAQLDHDRRASKTTRSNRMSAPLSAVIRARPGNSM